jgi:ferredoxin
MCHTGTCKSIGMRNSGGQRHTQRCGCSATMHSMIDSYYCSSISHLFSCSFSAARIGGPVPGRNVQQAAVSPAVFKLVPSRASSRPMIPPQLHHSRPRIARTRCRRHRRYAINSSVRHSLHRRRGANVQLDATRVSRREMSLVKRMMVRSSISPSVRTRSCRRCRKCVRSCNVRIGIVGIGVSARRTGESTRHHISECSEHAHFRADHVSSMHLFLVSSAVAALRIVRWCVVCHTMRSITAWSNMIRVSARHPVSGMSGMESANQVWKRSVDTFTRTNLAQQAVL